MERLPNLIRRLSSNHDGEVVATVRAIERTLQAEGCDWHDLADRLSQSNGWQEPPPLYDMAVWLHTHADFSAWECQFIPSVLTRLRARAQLTPKQEEALRRCYAKHGGPNRGAI